MAIFSRIWGHRHHDDGLPDEGKIQEVLKDPAARRMAAELYRHLSPGDRHELEHLARLRDGKRIREFISTRALQWEEILKHAEE